MIWRQKERRAMKYVAKAIQQYSPDEIFVGFSGGGDSMLCLNLIKKYIPNVKAFHANTGIGIEKTRQFCRDYCKDNGIELVEIRAKEDCGQDYDDFVMEHGFPGAGMHYRMYQRLKERPIAKLHRDYKKKRGNKIMMLTGIRYFESTVRAGYKNSIIDVAGGVVWVNPVYWFTNQEKYDYLKDHNIPTNPVSDVIGMSGECLCGAFASEDERELIRMVEPAAMDRIEKLEKEAWDRGHTWKWHQSPTKYHILEKHGQSNMFRPFCTGCGKREEEFKS